MLSGPCLGEKGQWSGVTPRRGLAELDLANR